MFASTVFVVYPVTSSPDHIFHLIDRPSSPSSSPSSSSSSSLVPRPSPDRSAEPPTTALLLGESPHPLAESDLNSPQNRIWTEQAAMKEVAPQRHCQGFLIGIPAAESPTSAGPSFRLKRKNKVNQNMKNLSKFTALLAAGLAFGTMALAGPKDDRPAPPNGGGNAGPKGDKVRPNDVTRFEVPGIGKLPKDVELPDALKKALDEFNALRLKQTETQKELLAKLGTSTKEEKQAIKDQLRANRDQFLEDTKQLRADIREQIKALREKLKDTLPVGGGDKGGKGPGRKGG